MMNLHTMYDEHSFLRTPAVSECKLVPLPMLVTGRKRTWHVGYTVTQKSSCKFSTSLLQKQLHFDF